MTTIAIWMMLAALVLFALLGVFIWLQERTEDALNSEFDAPVAIEASRPAPLEMPHITYQRNASTDSVRVEVWGFDSGRILLDMDSLVGSSGLSSVLRLSPEEARVIADALIAAADATTVVEVPA